MKNMEDLTFGEQVKIILGRKGMTIKQLAELIEVNTGKKMSRQNLTQRLGRDNFQEQDMRMIAEILGCPFHLSIMSGEMQTQHRSISALEKAAAVRVEAVEQQKVHMADATAQPQEMAVSEEPEQPYEEEAAEQPYEEAAEEAQSYEAAVTEETAQPESGAGEVDMTIGELYDMHKELAELEENAKAGETVEEIKKELERPKKDWFHTGGIFLRRKRRDAQETEPEEKNGTEAASASQAVNEQQAEAVQQPEAEEYKNGMEPEYTEEAGEEAAGELDGYDGEMAEESAEEPAAAYEEPAAEPESDFEPVIAHNDAAEDTVVGEVNPYTGREYQSNSVRMHPTRIGYVQVYDRTIHKWTDMTEWAFLGLQERKKALLGKAYEPPIYLD